MAEKKAKAGKEAPGKKARPAVAGTARAGKAGKGGRPQKAAAGHAGKVPPAAKEKRPRPLTLKAFEARGKMRERGNWKPFTKVVQGFNEGHARQTLHALMGSNHGVNRRGVVIEALAEKREA